MAGQASRRQLFARFAALYPSSVVALSIVHAVAPSRSGPLALSQVLAPHLFLLALLLVPFAAVRGAVLLRTALLLELAVFVLRFGTGAVTWPAAPTTGARQEVVATWNLLSDGRDVRPTLAALRASDAAIFGLQELSDTVAAAIEQDRVLLARYPHRLTQPRRDVLGIGLLSAYPIVDSGRLSDPPLIWATLDLGARQTLTVVTAHPLPARIGTLGPLPVPVRFDPELRDQAIARVREVVDRLVARGQPTLLIGDFNVTDREPAYRELTAGLVDAQRVAGSWPPSTWRPSFAIGWPVGLLRIDYLLAGPGVRPLRAGPDCTPSGSDHCVVRGVFELS